MFSTAGWSHSRVRLCLQWRTERAETFAEVFKEYGAIRTVDAWGDDVPTGKTTFFRKP